MAIAPIDLQTLFTQLDKVAKTQTSQREGQAMHQAIQGVQLQRKTEEQINQVNEAQNMGEGAEKIKDRPERGKNSQAGDNRNRNSREEDDKDPPSVLRDPYLGRNIDISL